VPLASSTRTPMTVQERWLGACGCTCFPPRPPSYPPLSSFYPVFSPSLPIVLPSPRRVNPRGSFFGPLLDNPLPSVTSPFPPSLPTCNSLQSLPFSPSPLHLSALLLSCSHFHLQRKAMSCSILLALELAFFFVLVVVLVGVSCYNHTQTRTRTCSKDNSQCTVYLLHNNITNSLALASCSNNRTRT
jgi:hypothetical protein